MDDAHVDKKHRLKREGALHPHPEKVSSGLLSQSEFFDANDLVQMKYEMLRSVTQDGVSVTDAARTFGLSRVAFYRTQQQYQHQGLPGLLPQKRGPKEPHKLTDAVMDFVREQLPSQPVPPDWQQLSERIEQQFGTTVHPRSIERAVKKSEKRGAR